MMHGNVTTNSNDIKDSSNRSNTTTSVIITVTLFICVSVVAIFMFRFWRKRRRRRLTNCAHLMPSKTSPVQLTKKTNLYETQHLKPCDQIQLSSTYSMVQEKKNSKQTKANAEGFREHVYAEANIENDSSEACSLIGYTQAYPSKTCEKNPLYAPPINYISQLTPNSREEKSADNAIYKETEELESTYVDMNCSEHAI